MNSATRSLLSQLLSVIDQYHFATAVRATRSDFGSKGFSSWDHFTSMLFCQLAQAKSLREIHSGLRSCEGKLQHFGMNRTCLAYREALQRSADRQKTLISRRSYRSDGSWLHGLWDVRGVDRARRGHRDPHQGKLTLASTHAMRHRQRLQHPAQ